MRHLAGSLCSFGLGLSALCHAVGADQSATEQLPDAIVIRSAGASGHFALALRSAEKPSEVRHHIILVDTSASQTGVFRDQTLTVVQRLLSRIPADHQVLVTAVDSGVESLTDGFVSPSATGEAITRLARRTPMGATDLAAAIRGTLGNSANVPVSIAYVGDGMSAGDLMSANDLDTLVDELQSRQVSFHSMLLGPKVDAQLAGILANQTGGTLQKFDGQESQVDAVAADLQESVVVLKNLTTSDKDAVLAVSDSVVLRNDRHTVVYGSGHAGNGLTVTGDANGSARNWTIAAVKSAGPEIESLAVQAEQTHGLTSPYVGIQGLETAALELETLIQQSVEVAQQLKESGRSAEALQVAQRALLLDSANPTLTSMVASLQDEVLPADRLGPPQVEEGNALSQTEARNEIITQQLVQSVNAAIAEAQRVAAEQPEYALTLLKDVLEAIRASREIAPEKRDELDRRVVAAITKVDSARQTNEIRQRQLQEARANQDARDEHQQELQQEEQRLQTLISQVRGLLDRARHGDPTAFEEAEIAARTALDMKPGNGTASAALVMSEASGQLSKAYQLINLRHDRFLEVLYQVELSHVPFPDEPPIQYPPADVWRALSLARKEKYKSVSLRSEKPIELWLEKMLDEPLPRPLSYPGEESLAEILRFISESYSAEGPYTMRIILDEKDQDIGTDPDFLENTQVSNVDLAGITLRNALELIFAKVKDQELTFMIKNEVMMVTTVATAESEENLVTRVYDVADLVVQTFPILGGGGQGGGQGGFGGGGQGGGQGGFGGGQGGFGGGQGGGQFSMPAEKAPQKSDDGIKLKSSAKKKSGQ